MLDYNTYKYNFVDFLIESGKYVGVIILVSYFFYRSIWVFVTLLATLPIFLKHQKKELISKRKQKLSNQFCYLLESINANVRAGYAVENAFMEAYTDMVSLFGGNALICQELIVIKKGLSINVSLEKLVKDLGKRSDIEEIVIFSKVFEAAKRNGGNMSEVLERTSSAIRTAREVEKEIEVLISQKKFELLIMEAVPFLLIGYIEATSKGYFDILYHNTRGILFMTVCLVIYIVAVFWGSKLIKINV